MKVALLTTIIAHQRVILSEMPKLGLDRDFTRFLNDPTFPYRVTVCIGDERIVCSGALLAQQSSVLEKKFRADDGILIFEEMVDVKKSNEVLLKCMDFLHGADLTFTIDNIEIVLKFASWYKILSLFEEGLIWIQNHLNDSQSVKLAMDCLRISNCLNANESIRLKSAVRQFIRSNQNIVRMNIGDYLNSSVSGYDISLIVSEIPLHSGVILKQWTALSSDNKSFVTENHDLFDFMNIFSSADEFSAFVSHISTETSSVESVKILLEIQKRYFSLQKVLQNNELRMGLNSSVPIKKSASFVFTESNSLSVIIKNVPNSATEARLRCLFKSVGRIDNVKMDRSEKTAIIAFQDSASVSRLINSHCNYSMDGCHLHVSPYDDSVGYDYNLTTVFVGNLPASATQKDLVQLFKFAGRVTDIEWNPKDCFAILYFVDTLSANNLLNCGRRFMLHGNVLKIDECEEVSTQEAACEEDTVYVGNIPHNASKSDLKTLFSVFGKIAQVTLKSNRDSTYRYAFIVFENSDSSIALLRSSRTRQFTFQGHNLKIAKKENKR